MDMNSRNISNVLQNGSPVTSQVGAYNTYVGARYVPIFDGEWVATKQYEPLVIVTSGGDSYTSKQYVPAGTPVTNETFWAHTGNWNGQLEILRQEVINNTVSINEIEGDIDTLSNDVYAFIGDSFGVNMNNNIGWIDSIISIMGLTSGNYYSYAQGGSGFQRKVSGGVNYVDMINACPAELANRITIVAVESAGNDYAIDGWTQSDEINAIITFYNACKAKFPKLKYITVHMCLNSLSYSNNKQTFFQIFNALPIEIKIDTYAKTYCMFVANLQDTQHPNTTGAKYLAYHIAMFLKGNPVIMGEGNGFLTDGTVRIDSRMTLSGVMMTLLGYVTVTANQTAINLHTYSPGDSIYNINNDQYYGQFTLTKADGSSTIPAYLWKTSNKLQLVTNISTPAGTYHLCGSALCPL